MRLFVAVWPPDDVLDALEQLPRPDVPGLRWTTRDQWHVTLRFLGEVTALDDVVDALGAGSLGMPREVEVGPASAALGRTVVVLPVAGLDDVAEGVIAATAALGRPLEARPYHGHLTLARSRRRSARRHAGTPFSATFLASEVTVVESRLHPHGARYSIVHRIALT